MSALKGASSTPLSISTDLKELSSGGGGGILLLRCRAHLLKSSIYAPDPNLIAVLAI